MNNNEARELLKTYSQRISDIQSQIGAIDSAVKKSKSTVAKIGDVVTFGKYEWYVIDKRADACTLLCKDIVEKRAYNTEEDDITWEKSTLRKWLNNDFYNSFTSDEKSRIIRTRNINKDTYVDDNFNPTSPGSAKYHTSGGNDTEDYIYLLSYDEAKSLSEDIQVISELWWLRSPNVYNDLGHFVYAVESSKFVIGYCADGYSMDFAEIGVRPALNLKL